MRKKIIGLFLVLLISILVISGCGSAKSDSKAVAPAGAPMAGKTAESEESKADSATALAGSGEASRSVANAILNERKVIRNANLSVEVEDFEKAYGKLEFLIAGIGYVQETKINKDKHYISDKEVLRTRGTIIIRVDAEKFSSVLKDVKGLGLLLEENIKSDDVTDKFFDLESRLRLIKYEESRLEEYLKKITDPDTIFKTEARLTEIRHEIESLTGNLNKLSNLVKLSTITINMSEKDPGADNSSGSYWQKLVSGFVGSFKGVIEFCGELIIAVVTAIPVLVLIAIFGYIVFVVYRKLAERHLKFNTRKDKDIEG